jgi:GDPmannose 4,6-dehydratase
MKKVLITGITGQDGSFLARDIALKYPDSYIYGVSRNKDTTEFFNRIRNLGVINIDKFKIFNIDLLNLKEICNLISALELTAIFNLSGPSSVYESLQNPKLAHNQITLIFDNLIKSLQMNSLKIPFYQASSSEMFGKGDSEILTENSNFYPESPYAKAKLQNHNKVIELSQDFDIKSGIMFNHESEFRQEKFLFSKIITNAAKIKRGTVKKFTVGSLTYERDWLFAGDVTKAMMRIMEDGKQNSYIIGSGKSHSIKYLISIIFNFYGLNWQDYVDVDSNLLRKKDPEKIYCNPERLINELNWKPEYSFEQLVERCIINNKFS